MSEIDFSRKSVKNSVVVLPPADPKQPSVFCTCLLSTFISFSSLCSGQWVFFFSLHGIIYNSIAARKLAHRILHLHLCVQRGLPETKPNVGVFLQPPPPNPTFKTQDAKFSLRFVCDAVAANFTHFSTLMFTFFGANIELSLNLVCRACGWAL